MDHCAIASLFSATLLKVVYGIDIDDDDHEIVRGIRAAVEAFSEAMVPGKFMVEFIPWLEYVPAWVPGAGFQKKFAEWRALTAAMKNAPFEQRNTYLVRVYQASVEGVVDSSSLVQNRICHATVCDCHRPAPFRLREEGQT